MRKKPALLTNTLSSFMVQMAAILSSFIVPKCILSSFGSVANGTVTSITGFLGFISLMEAGVGNVSRAALFSPVANRDQKTISYVVNETHAYFRKVAIVYCVFVGVFASVFPLTIDNGEGYLFNFTLVFAIALGNFFQYYFGAGYLQVLWADQKVYLLNISQAIAYTLNIAVAIVCAKLGSSIHVMKLLSSVVFLIRPLFVNLYVRKKYHIDVHAKSDKPVLTQKWNNMLQTVAYFVHSKTDVVVLTYLGSLTMVSIYSVYAMITTGLSSIINSLCYGFTAKVGHHLGANEHEKLLKTFDIYEHFVYNLTFLVFTTAGIIIVDFISVYTKGLDDANYYQPFFAFIIILAEAAYCIRLPYSNMISVAGHFKETQNAAIIEAVLNIVCSVLMVHKFGLIGISVGTLLAMVYRTIYQIHYLSRQILFRPWIEALKKFLVFLPVPCLSWVISFRIVRYLSPNSYITWVIEAAVVFAIALSLTSLIDFVFFKSLTKESIACLLGRKRKKKD